MKNWWCASARIVTPPNCRSWIWMTPEGAWQRNERAVENQIVSGQCRARRPGRARGDHLLQSARGTRGGQGSAAIKTHTPDFPLHETLRREAQLAFLPDVSARPATARAGVADWPHHQRT